MRALNALIPVILALTACNPTPKAAQVEKAWVRLPAVVGNPGAAYFTLRGGPVADRLMTVSSPMAIKAEMHDMAMNGAMMSMAPIEAGVEVPAGGMVSFAPSGKHVMLFDISPKITPGKKVTLKFSFASGATIEAEADTIAAGGEAPHAP